MKVNKLSCTYYCDKTEVMAQAQGIQIACKLIVYI